MSYILDALRRADSERERGAVPTLHARPVPAVAAGPARPPLPGSAAWTLGGAALLVCVLALLVWRGRDATTQRNDAPTVAAPAAAPVTMPVSAPAPVPAPVPVPVPTAPPASADAPASAGPTTTAPRREAVAVTPSPRPATATPREPPRSPSVVAERSAPPKTAASSPPVRIPTRAELTERLQRELPDIAVGGATYSASAANRMLIVNGQVFHEGDVLAPGLLLEQIRLKSAVLSYRGQRYSIAY